MFTLNLVTSCSLPLMFPSTHSKCLVSLSSFWIPEHYSKQCLNVQRSSLKWPRNASLLMSKNFRPKDEASIWTTLTGGSAPPSHQGTLTTVGAAPGRGRHMWYFSWGMKTKQGGWLSLNSKLDKHNQSYHTNSYLSVCKNLIMTVPMALLSI